MRIASLECVAGVQLRAKFAECSSRALSHMKLIHEGLSADLLLVRITRPTHVITAATIRQTHTHTHTVVHRNGFAQETVNRRQWSPQKRFKNTTTPVTLSPPDDPKYQLILLIAFAVAPNPVFVPWKNRQPTMRAKTRAVTIGKGKELRSSHSGLGCLEHKV